MVLAVSYVRAFRVVAIPQSGYTHGIPAQFLKSTAAHASLPSLRLLVMDAGVCTASPLGELLLGL